MLVAPTPLRLSGSDRLGRYYTADGIGQLLVDQMDHVSPTQVLDLGAGNGVLSLAAARRWSGTRILTVDIDGRARTELRHLFKMEKGAVHSHLRANALDVRLPELIGRVSSSIDAAVCNPPFVMPRWDKGYIDILREAGFKTLPPTSRDIEAPAIFLAQNMRILSPGSTLGIILPDSLISAARYRWFRKELVENYAVQTVVKLPRRCFAGTDAQAHVLVIQKITPSRASIPLRGFECVDDRSVCNVSFDEAVDRMDVDYHIGRRFRRKKKASVSLADLAVDIKRGQVENRVARDSGIEALHTTDISIDDVGRWVDLPGRFDLDQNSVVSSMVIAEPGDILVGRVGRNFDAKIVGVKSGRALLTDCVYRLRCVPHVRNKLLQALTSSEGRLWLRSQAHGVSATQLTKSALLTFVI